MEPETERTQDEPVNYEPLLAVEKKLLAWSVGLGAVLLLLLLWVTRGILGAD